MRDHTDPELLALYRRGRQDAFELLVERHGAALKGFAIRMLHNAEQAEEVYVETFLRLAAARGQWEERGTVRGYLFTVARRLCLDLLRHRRVMREAMPGVVALEEGRAMPPSPEARALLGEQASLLEQALGQLPEEQREVLLMRTIHGLSAAEVASATGLRVDQVDSALSYARRCLRGRMAALQVGEPRREGVR